jgi:hypothetical protein
MSAAYKYAAMQAFAIPTEGDNDTENQNIEPAPKTESALSEKVFADYKATLDDAATFDVLKEMFAAAYKAAAAINDRVSMGTFQKIYEQKKAIFLGGQA